MHRNSYQNRRSSGGYRGRSNGQPGSRLRPVDWSHQTLPQVSKLSWQTPRQAEDAVASFRTQNELKVSGESIPDPLFGFQDAGFPQPILQQFDQLGFTAPTPIQAQAWPMILNSHDVLGIAETGSGKTLSFVLPGVLHIQNQQMARRSGPICLCVAPTRELAQQIEAETKKFANPLGISVASCYGGAPKRDQERAMRQGVDFLIATPGRLLDFMERRVITMDHCSYVVFDEADRMLDMGFEPQIRAVMGQIRPDRQMLMFSATWPRAVEKLAGQFLNREKLMIKVGDENKACVRVTQHVEVIERYRKSMRLDQILKSHPNEKIIIFTATKRMADQLSNNLHRQGFYCDAIHGDKDQHQRNRTLRNFKSGQINILVATDVASRGIDVKNLSLVVNYDFPKTLDDYIHRIGRTGRAGAYGTAISFFSVREDAKNANRLVQLLEKSNQAVPEDLRNMPRWNGGDRRSHKRRRSGGPRSGRGGSRRANPYQRN